MRVSRVQPAGAKAGHSGASMDALYVMGVHIILPTEPIRNAITGATTCAGAKTIIQVFDILYRYHDENYLNFEYEFLFFI